MAVETEPLEVGQQKDERTWRTSVGISKIKVPLPYSNTKDDPDWFIKGFTMMNDEFCR